MKTFILITLSAIIALAIIATVCYRVIASGTVLAGCVWDEDEVGA